jgi:SAM-dependent methyltransferase
MTGVRQMDQDKIDEVIGLFKSRVSEREECFSTTDANGRLGYVPSYNTRFDMLRDTQELHKENLSFLELGCGFGNNALRAALQGYNATGIDIREYYVDFGNKVIQDLKKEGLIDQSIQVRLFFGNFMDKNTLQWYTDNWTGEASRVLSKPKEEVLQLLSHISSDELDVLTEADYRKVIGRPYESVRKLGLPFTRRADVSRLIGREWKTIEKIIPRNILANPYKFENEDVYDVMGKGFGEFDVIYLYPWGPEELPLSRMLQEEHPEPYILYERPQGRIGLRGLPVIYGDYKVFCSREAQLSPERVFTED